MAYARRIGILALLLSCSVIAKPIASQLHARASSYLPVVELKWIETALALLAAGLVTLTYAILIGAGTRMTSTSKLPLLPIVQNIGTILEATWPDLSSSAVCGPTETDTIKLLYIAKMGDGRYHAARGLRESEASPDVTLATPSFWLTSGSQLTTNVVQLAVWEWVFLWMNMGMVASTLLYNGVFTDNHGPDSYVRVTLVLIYASAYCLHAIFVWHSVTTFFTMVAAGSAWSMLHRANFAVVDSEQFKQRLESSRTNPSRLDFRLIDKASTAFVPANYTVKLEHEADDADLDSQTSERTNNSNGVISSLETTILEPHSEENVGLQEALANIKAVQKWERQNATNAAQTALYRVVANGMIMTTIIISSGFIMWTSSPTDTPSTQLGSLGLLASISLGVAAMFTSAVQMTILNSAFRMILHMKEVNINGHAVDYTKKRVSGRKNIGFIYGKLKSDLVRGRDLIKTASVWDVLSLLLFGPSFTLLPTSADHALESEGAHFQLTVTIRGERVVMTTGGTDKHSKDKQGANLEAINVCYRPRSEPPPIIDRRGVEEV